MNDREARIIAAADAYKDAIAEERRLALALSADRERYNAALLVLDEQHKAARARTRDLEVCLGIEASKT